MIPQPFIYDLLNRIDIVDAIDARVALKKAGANYVACCPFHSEKTPSFTVSPAKQFYHCFGCGAHGNAISFLMEYSGLSFTEAVGDLASRAGLSVPEQAVGAENPQSPVTSSSQKTIHQRLLEVMKAATRFYQGQLKNSEEAIAYLKKRGLTGETAARFAIGYAPPGWQSLSAAFPDYQTKEMRDLLVMAGLIIAGNDGGHYDRFRSRIMFPILDQKGKIIGFGGRVLEQGEPKYMNSPETPLFAKSHELYNLFAARSAIRKAEKVLVVEGYMDVVALAQHDIHYTVAALGTAITGVHIQKLLRQTDHIIFCFDGDQAGRKAARRALENSLSQLVDGKYLGFLFLPEGEDPDSYVRQHGKALFERQLEEVVPLSEFLFKDLLTEIDLQTSEGCAKLVRDAKPLLKQVTAPTLRLMLCKRLSELSGLSQHELEAILQLKHQSRVEDKGFRSAPRQQPATPYYWLIFILLYQPNYIQKLDRDLLSAFAKQTDELAALKALIAFLDVSPEIVDGTSEISITAYFNESPYLALFEKIESEMLELSDSINLEAEFFGALRQLREVKRKQRMTELQSKSLSKLTIEEKKELQKLAVS